MPAAAEEILDDAVDRREALEVREPHLAGVPTIRHITDPRWPFPLCIPANRTSRFQDPVTCSAFFGPADA